MLYLNVTIEEKGKLAFFTRSNTGYSMIHCCIINNYFKKNSVGGFNSINTIGMNSNITFWQDWYWGKYYSADKDTTFGLNTVDSSLVTVHNMWFNVTAEYKKSSSFIMNEAIN